jgi:Ras-related GTP-binding protein A/B
MIVFFQKDLDQFQGCVEAIEENSEDAAVFVLIHKMDLVPLEEREQVGIFILHRR